MTTKTLERLTVGKPWSGQYGEFEVWQLHFADGTTGELNVKKGNLDKAKAKLDPLVGKPEEYELESTKLEKVFKVKDYPAKNPDGSKDRSKSWQPKSLEERAEMMAGAAIKAWAEVAMAEDGETALRLTEKAMESLYATALRIVKASGTEGPSVTGKGATASSVPDDNVEAGSPDAAQRRSKWSAGSEEAGPSVAAPSTDAASTTTSGASDPLDATPDRDGDGTAPRPQEPPSDDEPEQGGAVSSRHVHEWKDAPREGWVSCSVCGIARKREDVEVGP